MPMIASHPRPVPPIKLTLVSAHAALNMRCFMILLAPLQPGLFTRYLQLQFARTVGTDKIVEALTAVQGVDSAAVDQFSSLLTSALPKGIAAGHTLSLGWEGKDTLAVLVNGKQAGEVKDAALPGAVYEVRLQIRILYAHELVLFKLHRSLCMLSAQSFVMLAAAGRV
jgi:hypothetical protein